MAEEILRQYNVDSVTWLLVITPMLIYSEKEHKGEKEIQNASFEEKGGI